MTVSLSWCCMSLWFCFNDSCQPEVSAIKCQQLEGSDTLDFMEVLVEAKRKGSDLLLASAGLPTTPPVCDRDPQLRAWSHRSQVVVLLHH